MLTLARVRACTFVLADTSSALMPRKIPTKTSHSQPIGNVLEFSSSMTLNLWGWATCLSFSECSTIPIWEFGLTIDANTILVVKVTKCRGSTKLLTSNETKIVRHGVHTLFDVRSCPS